MPSTAHAITPAQINDIPYHPLKPAANAQTLMIGVSHYPPHIYAKNNKISGSAKNYIRQIVAAAGYKSLFLHSPRKRQYQLLTNGNISLAFPMQQNHGDDDNLNIIGESPMNYEIPGLCFKKADYIPFLSLRERWRTLNILYPGGMKLIPILKKYNQNLTALMGERAIERSIGLVILGRADAAYVPNVNSIYHINSKFYPDIACSNFYGNSTSVYLVASKKLDNKIFKQLRQAYRNSDKYRAVNQAEQTSRHN